MCVTVKEMYKFATRLYRHCHLLTMNCSFKGRKKNKNSDITHVKIGYFKRPILVLKIVTF